jgi:signal transduction histidine kinase
MKKALYLVCLLIIPAAIRAQNINLDSIIKVVAARNRNKTNHAPINKDELFHRFTSAEPGKERVKLIYELMYDEHSDSKQIVKAAYTFLKWATDHHDPISEAVVCAELASIVSGNGDQDIAIKLYNEALSAAEKSDNSEALGIVYENISQRTGIKPQSSKDYAWKAIKFSLAANDSIRVSWAYVILVYYYRNIKLADSVKYYSTKGLDIAVNANSINDIVIHLATLGKATNNDKFDLKCLKAALQISESSNDYYAISGAGSQLTAYFWDKNELDSALLYARNAYAAAKNLPLDRKENPIGWLAYIYTKKRNIDSAIYNNASIVRAQAATFAEQQKQQQANAQKIAARNSLRLYVLIAAMAFFGVIAFILARNNKKTREANLLLAKQKDKIELTLSELKATQTQLIQSEKMASLGELTAGIAHEIQNPLNFVNNFSDVNSELLVEMQQEIEKGDLAEIKALSLDIYENEKKINQHGKRADSIVKGMLEHSRTRSGQKEPTDLNVMADEFMRLSYHGLRAKDKSFNSELVTYFEPDLPKANMVQQDIGRVLLNLFNNAFYAVSQKKKIAGADYKPEVSVTTSSSNGQIIIKVHDNGTGIPEAIKDKIMQPFFTTKPTGEGTGLGLSLTYDMVVKGQCGTIDVNTVEGEFTEFIVTLPLI